MANINSVTSNSYSSSSSIYGNRNVLTGLASGMDTEAMIQNSVTGYQTKISELQQSQTKLEWKQDAYRELIDQAYNITQSYTSFTSTTNLTSNAFFNNAITTETNGAHAKAVSASGTSKSSIQINSVTQLATSARYSIDADALNFSATSSLTGKAINWDLKETVGQVKGTMTLKYGSQTINLDFSDKDTFGFEDGDDAEAKMEKLRKVIEDKLGEVDLKVSSGTVKARALIDVKVDGNQITFSENASHPDKSGNAVYIDSVSGNITQTLGAKKPTSTELAVKIENNSFYVPNDCNNLVGTPSVAENIKGKTVDVTLDGTTKQIKIGDLTGTKIEINGEEKTLSEALGALNDENTSDSDKTTIQNAINTTMNNALKTDLQNSIDKQFGKGKITVKITNGALDFEVGSTSTLNVTSEAGSKIGIGDGVSNYFNTSAKLGSLLGESWLNSNARTEATGTVTSKTEDGETKYYDADGNRVAALYDDPAGKYYRVDDKGNFLYHMEINGAKIDGFTADTTLERVLSLINSNADVGVNASYSNLTRQFVFTSRDTGSGSDITFGDGVAKALFTADNSPENMTLEQFFGDAVKWNSNGQATLMVTGTGGNASLGSLSKSTKLSDLLEQLNSNPYYQDMIQYDESAGRYKLIDKSSGDEMSTERAQSFSFVQRGQTANSQDGSLSFDTLFSKIPGGVKEAGQDAKLEATVNGKTIELERSSNVINMDGMTVTLKDTFTAEKGDEVTFTSSSDADKIVETVKGFVDEVNKLLKGVYSAYTTQRPTKTSSSSSSGISYYEPLTEEDKNSMSESAVKNYEEKAKTGLLFGDNDLATMYDKLRSAITAYGSDRVDMEAIGLTTSYSDGVTTISLDEKKLRAALESDPDKVRTTFTKTKEGGSSSDGLMARLKSTLNAYASTSLGSQGILVRKAGTKLSSVSLLNNNIQSQIDNYSKQIESWQTKLSNKIDYYTKQFTQLEKLMSQMNNQSSMLADLMGY